MCTCTGIQIPYRMNILVWEENHSFAALIRIEIATVFYNRVYSDPYSHFNILVLTKTHFNFDCKVLRPRRNIFILLT